MKIQVSPLIQTVLKTLPLAGLLLSMVPQGASASELMETRSPHPLVGEWKLQYLTCTSPENPEGQGPQELRPVSLPGGYFRSNFSPDITLSFSTLSETEHPEGSERENTSEPVGNSQFPSQNELTQKPIHLMKSLTTQSCTDSRAKAVRLSSQSNEPGIFMAQEFFMRTNYFPHKPHVGFLLGDSLGEAHQYTEEPVSPWDCDATLGLLHRLFGEGHVQEELNRVYTYFVKGPQLRLTYFDYLPSNQCPGKGNQTVLVFERSTPLSPQLEQTFESTGEMP